MPHYRYQLRGANGQTTMGVMAADNAMAAASQLRAQGHQVLQLTPVNANAGLFCRPLAAAYAASMRSSFSGYAACARASSREIMPLK